MKEKSSDDNACEYTFVISHVLYTICIRISLYMVQRDVFIYRCISKSYIIVPTMKIRGLLVINTEVPLEALIILLYESVLTKLNGIKRKLVKLQLQCPT